MKVLSTSVMMPFDLAMAHTAWMSTIFRVGFVGDSSHIILVSGLMAASSFAGSVTSTIVTAKRGVRCTERRRGEDVHVMPAVGLMTRLKRRLVPP